MISGKTIFPCELTILTRQLLAVWMIFLLLLLTSMNFFIYSPSFVNKNNIEAAAGDNGETESNNLPSNPSGPDEKSPNSCISINEEYVHEQEEMINPYVINQFQYGIADAEKLYVVHFEILSPPPKHI